MEASSRTRSRRANLVAAAIALVAGALGSGVLVALPNNSVSDDVFGVLVRFGLGGAGAIGGLAGGWVRRHRVTLPAGLLGYAVPWVYAFGTNNGSSFEEDVMYGTILLVAFSAPFLIGYGVGAFAIRLVRRLWGLEPPATEPRGGDSPPSSYTERYAGLERTSDEAPKATDQEKPPGRRNAVIIVGVLPAIIAIPIGIASVAASGSILGLVGAAVFYLFLAGFVGLLYGAVIVTERMSFWAPLEAAARPVGRVFGWWFNVSGCLRVAVLIVTGTVGVLGASAMLVIAVVGLP